MAARGVELVKRAIEPEVNRRATARRQAVDLGVEIDAAARERHQQLGGGLEGDDGGLAYGEIDLLE